MNLTNSRVLLLSVFMFFSLLGVSFAECDGFHKLNQEGAVSLGGYTVKLVDVSQTYPYPAVVEVSYNGMFVSTLEVKVSVGYPENVESFSAVGGQIMKIEVCKTEVLTEDNPQTVKAAYLKLSYEGSTTSGGGQGTSTPCTSIAATSEMTKEDKEKICEEQGLVLVGSACCQSGGSQSAPDEPAVPTQIEEIAEQPAAATPCPSLIPPSTELKAACSKKGGMLKESKGLNGCALGYYCADGAAVTPKQAMKCVIDENLMKELDELVLKLKQAQEAGDASVQAQLIAAITNQKERINNAQQTCTSGAAGGGSAAGTTTTVVAEESNSCTELVKWQEKKKYYEDISTGKKKGAYDEKDLAKTLSELDKGIEKLQKKCFSQKKNVQEAPSTSSIVGKIAFWWGKVNQYLQSDGTWTTDPDGVSGANLDPFAYCQKWYPAAKGVIAGDWEIINHWKDRGNLKDYSGEGVKYTVYYCIAEEGDYTGVAATSEAIAPVAPTQASEVSDYYREKITNIMGETQNVETQISSLKQLRLEIDSLVSQLIQKQKNIKMSEMSALMEDVEVTPGEINSGGVQVKNIKDKVFETNIGNAPVEVTSGENSVMLSQNGLEVESQKIVMTKEGISVGGREVQISPQKIVETLKSMPTSMSLSEENGQATYTANTEKQAKLFGILPVKVQNRIKVSAENGEVLSAETPFWAALTTNSE